jgi:hypothetical protein
MTRTSWIRPLARAGYAARGFVYLIVGFFAVLAAFGISSERDTEGALLQVLRQPFGTALVWLMIVGLVGFVIWRFVQAVYNTDGHGRGARGLAVRAGLLASAFTYATLALYSLSLIGVSSDGSNEPVVASAIEATVGARWVALLLGLVFAGTAIAHFWKAASGKYKERFPADEEAMALIHPVSMIGLTARGFVFAVIAVLFFVRFRRADGGGEPPGLKEAFEFIQALPFGGALLATLGAGLLAFALYSFAEARWRRINAAGVL